MNFSSLTLKIGVSVLLSFGILSSTSLATTSKITESEAEDTRQTQKKTPIFLSSFSDIQGRYDLLLVDIMGVVHNGATGFKDCIDTLNTLHRPPYNKEILFLSNTQRLGRAAQQTIRNYGIDPDLTVFTSGDAIRQTLGQMGPKRVYHFGETLNPFLLKDLPNIQVTSQLKEAELVVLSHYITKEDSLDQFDVLLKEIASSPCPILCVNPDKTAPRGDSFYYCAGTFAQRIETFGGQVSYYGKPSVSLYETIQRLNSDVPKPRMLMIGDTLETDILGAQTFGIESLLVLTGNTAKDMEVAGQKPEVYLKTQAVKPTYILPSLILEEGPTRRQGDHVVD